MNRGKLRQLITGTLIILTAVLSAWGWNQAAQAGAASDFLRVDMVVDHNGRTLLYLPLTLYQSR
jgi:hypothetical protein